MAQKVSPWRSTNGRVASMSASQWYGAASSASTSGVGSSVRPARLRKNCSRPAGEMISRHERSEEHTSELQSLMRNSYAVFCLKKKKPHNKQTYNEKIDT